MSLYQHRTNLFNVMLRNVRNFSCNWKRCWSSLGVLSTGFGQDGKIDGIKNNMVMRQCNEITFNKKIGQQNAMYSNLANCIPLRVDGIVSRNLSLSLLEYSCLELIQESSKALGLDKEASLDKMEAMNRNGRKPKRANHGKRPCSHFGRWKKRSGYKKRLRRIKL